jgi:hypothetical protein
MSILADALQPFSLAGLNTIQGRPPEMTLADLIGKQNRIGFDLDFDDANGTIVTDFREASAVLNATASDSARFASAAFQSINDVPHDIVEREQTSWSLIKTYYAAFYAGHAIIRLTGESCSYFSKSHITRITDLGLASGKVPGYRLTASAYHCVIDAAGAIIRSGSLREGSGGAHEAFWATFGRRLSRISDGVLLGPLGTIEKLAVFNKLEHARTSIQAHNAPLFSYLSVIRNDVQYRHAHKVWLPDSLKKGDREQLSRLVGQWLRDPMDVDLGVRRVGMLGEFAVTCAFIIAVCRTLLMRIAERSQMFSRSFAKVGPLALISERELAA